MRRSHACLPLSLLVAALSLPCIAAAQIPAVPPAPPPGLQSLAQAAALNNERLHAYHWIETTTITVAGSLEPPRQSLCWYAAGGTASRVPVGQPPAAPSGGPLRQALMKSKLAQISAEIGEARELNARYFPIRPGELAQALQTRRIQFQRDTVGDESVIVMDFEKPGDQLRLDLDAVTKQLRSLSVSTYFSTPTEPMQASVQFAALEDGTRYPHVTVLQAPSRQISIRIEDSGFSRASL